MGLKLHVVVFITGILTAGAVLGKEKTKEQIFIEQALHAIDECNHGAGEVGDQSEERNTQIVSGIESACATAKRKIEEVSSKYPNNPQLLEGINLSIDSGVIDQEDPAIKRYCGGLVSFFKENPDSSYAGFFQSICPQQAKQVFGE